MYRTHLSRTIPAYGQPGRSHAAPYPWQPGRSEPYSPRPTSGSRGSGCGSRAAVLGLRFSGCGSPAADLRLRFPGSGSPGPVAVPRLGSRGSGCGSPARFPGVRRPVMASPGRSALPDPAQRGFGFSGRRFRRRQVLAVAPGATGAVLVMTPPAGDADHAPYCAAWTGSRCLRACLPRSGAGLGIVPARLSRTIGLCRVAPTSDRR
jgi:hypothetical protein